MKLTYKSTGIEIKADAFSNIDNKIRYLISAPFADGSQVVALFPDKTFVSGVDGLKYGGMVDVSNMADIFVQFKIDPSDLGKTIAQATDKWLINILYSFNLLNLKQADWQIVE